MLRVARPILDRAWTDQLRDELAWLGGSLGAVRDHDVLLLHVRAQGPTLGPAEQAPLERLAGAIEEQRESSRAQMLEALSSPRYLELLGRIELAGEAPRRRRFTRSQAATQTRHGSWR